MLRHSINQGMHYVTSYFLVHCIYLAFKKKKKYLSLVFENLNKWVQLALFDIYLAFKGKNRAVLYSKVSSSRSSLLFLTVSF